MMFSTVAAISTPIGKGGVALIRISGPESISVAEKVFRPYGNRKISDFPSRHQIYGQLLDMDGNVLDDGLLTYFSAPNSFTGEDVVEFCCHGGVMISQMVLSAFLSAGAIPAPPGEFSRRSFMNGKMSLTSAEGIADLLDAKTESAARLSSKAARGKLSERIEYLSERILEVASSLWAFLDYPEDELGALDDSEMLSRLDSIIFECRQLLKSFDTGRAICSGIPAAIIGKPNVGKSTFFNLFLGEERAIVTSIPGTTRDVIEYPLKCGRVLLNLSDTAGVRNTPGDRVEEIGIERALEAAKDAEVLFCIFDSSRDLEEDDRSVLRFLHAEGKDKIIIPIFSKTDLPFKLNTKEFNFSIEPFYFSDKFDFDFSKISDVVEKRFIFDEASLSEGRIVTNERQKNNLERTLHLLKETTNQILGDEKDVASITLEIALSTLLEIDGKAAGDKILSEVFSRFCVGK